MKTKVKKLQCEPCSHFKRSRTKSSLPPCDKLNYERKNEKFKMKTKVNILQCEPCSHFKRSHTKSFLPPCDKLNYKRQVREKVLNQRTGRITYNVSYKEVDRYSDMKDYRVSDFALENLLAIDAPLSVSKLSMSPLTQADQIVDVLQSKIDSSNL